MQTEFRLLARLTDCGRNANYCVMRITECPEGRPLTDTSEPCGHRLSGDKAGFGRSFELGRCVTGIKRADTANEIQFSPAKSSDIFCRRVRCRASWPSNGFSVLAVDTLTTQSQLKFPDGRSSGTTHALLALLTAGAAARAGIQPRRIEFVGRDTCIANDYCACHRSTAPPRRNKR